MPADPLSLPLGGLGSTLLEAGAAALHPAAQLGLEPGSDAVRALQTGEDPAKVRAAAQLVESYFLTMLLQAMRTPILDTDDDEEALFAPSREERLYTQQLDQALGDELARAGQLGLAELIVQQLLPEDPVQ